MFFSEIGRGAIKCGRQSLEDVVADGDFFRLTTERCIPPAKPASALKAECERRARGKCPLRAVAVRLLQLLRVDQPLSTNVWPMVICCFIGNYYTTDGF